MTKFQISKTKSFQEVRHSLENGNPGKEYIFGFLLEFIPMKIGAGITRGENSNWNFDIWICFACLREAPPCGTKAGISIFGFRIWSESKTE